MKHIDRLNKNDAAIIIVDLQKGYCDPTSDCANQLGWNVNDANQIAHDHVDFLKKIREIMRPERIIWLHMDESPETYAENLRYGPHRDDFYTLCVRGTTGHDFHVVSPNREEVEFVKFHPSGFSSKAFRDYLEKQDIKQLCFTGVISSRCVNSTLITASALGYECLIIEDLISQPAHLKDEAEHHLRVTTDFFAVSCSAEIFLEKLQNN